MHTNLKTAIAIATCWLATAASSAGARDTPEPPLADSAAAAAVAGPSAVVSDFGSLVKGAGAAQAGAGNGNGGGAIPQCPTCQSGPLFIYPTVTIGPGATQTIDWQINDAGPSSTHPTAPGVAGPSADANGNVSGWILVTSQKISSPIPPHTLSSGNLTWSATATPGNQFDFQLETLVGPTTPVGTTIDGAMSDFDPTQHYVWPFAAWQGTYTGPTDTPTLTADTLIDTSVFANAIAPNATFSIAYDGNPVVFGGTPYVGSLDLVYTPVPEPGTLGLVAVGLLGVWRSRRRGR